MTAQTRGSIARLALRRDDVYVTLSRDPAPEIDVMIGDGDNYREWHRRFPTLAETATIAEPGLLVLVRPRAALERRSSAAVEAPVPEDS